eukprot:CAMPEP_0181238318 /NCGR_PEP_ID=MMETSP1096-20121128/39269_1 /TAXON_ID=156174 ORGANISM="Chrysochromulina ericina, Strain CCMP281" /NCGR_SAMPLE_ID=MMETSP1096 /ASSEMBLY_ACC=CAM_ASM_000453 /LENGTH=97 /DNA_ID=CAMNT_0023333805 /DNA_START=91 /DNA_END=381 /DNA_ORIENTATION=-
MQPTLVKLQLAVEACGMVAGQWGLCTHLTWTARMPWCSKEQVWEGAHRRTRAPAHHLQPVRRPTLHRLCSIEESGSSGEEKAVLEYITQMTATCAAS